MSFKRVCCFLLLEVIVAIPLALMVYWLLSLRTNNFTGENMLIYLHGVVMMFAFSYLLAQGIALIRVCPSSKRCAKITHSVFNTLAMIFAIAGIILIVSYKSKNRVAHFQSIHSWCGLFLLFVLMIQFVGGSIVLQSCCKGASLKSRMNYVPTHVAMGTAILLLTVVSLATGIINLKDYLELGPVTTRELDFENSLLNLVAALTAIIFLVILCLAVSRRTRRSIEYTANNTDGDKIGLYQVEANSSNNKSKQLSCDTAYSDFSSAPDSTNKTGHVTRGEPPRRASQGGDGKHSAIPLPESRRDSGSRDRDSDPHASSDMMRNGDPLYRDPQTRDPLSPGSLRSKRLHQDPRLQDQSILSPTSRSPPAHPGDIPRQQSSPSFHNPSTSPTYPTHLDKRGSCPATGTPSSGYPDRSYHSPQGIGPAGVRSPSSAAAHQKTNSLPEFRADRLPSSPDIPPLFETNSSNTRGSRREMPLPLNVPPPPAQFTSSENSFPSQYGGQVQILDEREAAHPVTATSSPPQNRLSPHHPEPLSSTFNYPLSPPNYPLSPPNYPPSNGSGMVLSPDNMSPTSPPPITTFNARPMNRHQVARQVRYETRRAKVEKANMELQRSNTPPPISYTGSLAPGKPPSPLSPSSADSVISEDVDGVAPRRGRTSYRNAVRDDDNVLHNTTANPLTPPAKPPKPAHLAKNLAEKKVPKKSDEDIRWL